MNRVDLPYQEARPLIKEGDILLFRGAGWVSYFISRAGESPYTHCAVASWINDNNGGILECVEFREGKGGRSVNLSIQVDNLPGQIDVYRPIPSVTHWEYNPISEDPFSLIRQDLDARAVTNTMRKMTGLPYGWKRIWWLFKHKAIVLRLFTDVEGLTADELEDIVYPVCSTALAYCFNKNGYDLIHNKSDQWAEPADIARSARISYLFTLTKSSSLV